MRIVVTGGAGNVGRWVVAELARSHEVVVYDIAPCEGPPCEQVRGDILSLDDLRRGFTGADCVVHLAAIPHPLHDTPERVFRVNVLGTYLVGLAAAEVGVRRVIFASSDSTYGFVFGGYQAPYDVAYVPIDQGHPTRPRDPYGLSKKLGEDVLESLHRLHGTAVTCLRYCWVWYPADYPDPAALSADLPALLPMLFGYVDARDVAQAVLLAAERVESGFHVVPISAADTIVPVPTLELVARYFAPSTVVRQPRSFLADEHRTLWDLLPARDLFGYEPRHSWRSTPS